MFRRLLAFSTMSVCLTLGNVRAESKGSDPPDSPKQALRAQDSAAKAGKLEEDQSFYFAANDQEKTLAHAFAEGDVSLARLQAAVARRFGDELADAVVHAAGTKGLSDIEAATEKVDGDKASIEWKDHSTPLHVVRSEGKWKIALSEMLKGANSDQIESIGKAIQQLAVEFSKLTELVSKDKFRSGEGVRDRVLELRETLLK